MNLVAWFLIQLLWKAPPLRCTYILVSLSTNSFSFALHFPIQLHFTPYCFACNFRNDKWLRMDGAEYCINSITSHLREHRKSNKCSFDLFRYFLFSFPYKPDFITFPFMLSTNFPSLLPHMIPRYCSLLTTFGSLETIWSGVGHYYWSKAHKEPCDFPIYTKLSYKIHF